MKEKNGIVYTSAKRLLASVMEKYSELGVDNIKSGLDSSNLSDLEGIFYLYESTPRCEVTDITSEVTDITRTEYKI